MTVSLADVGEEEILQKLLKANETLGLLDKENKTLDRCRHYLSILMQAITKFGELSPRQ